jgi:bacterioferritin-associated ferredoxin
MYVCSCRAVTDRTVKAAIASGARTIDDLAERCGAGGRCGGCWPALTELLQDSRPADQRRNVRASSAA